MMTADNRAQMRRTLQTALRTSSLPAGSLEHPGPFDTPLLVSGDLIERFTAELVALGGAVHHAADAEAVADLVATLVSPQTPRKVLMWDERWLPIEGLPTMLVARGVSIDTQDVADMTSPERRHELASASAGITGVDAALAQTGSLVLVSGPGRGRLASLLPLIHIALVRRAQFLDSLSTLITRRPELVTAGANFVCITGPSRTGDIEMTLSRGVHGPGQVHVVIVD